MKEFNDTVKPCTKLCDTFFIYISHTHTYIYHLYHFIYTYHILYIYITFIYRYHIYTHNFFFNGICSKKNLKEFQNSGLWEHKTIAVIRWLYLYVKLCCMHIATKKVFKEPFQKFLFVCYVYRKITKLISQEVIKMCASKK